MTSEQIRLLQEAFPNGTKPSGDQTPEQATNYAVMGFQFVCRFEGIPVPSEAEIRKQLAEVSH